jgi:D-alanine transaminase
MPDIACLNGAFGPLDEARVPVEDRGYLFGDGVYEVIRTYGGAPFLLDAHLDRLFRSMGEISIAPDWDRDTLAGRIYEALRRAGHPEAKVYVQVTRGVAPREHAFPRVPPTTLVTVTAIHPLSEAQRTGGVSVITTPDIRWGRCDIKSLNLLPNVMARQAAAEAGAFEAVFVSSDGTVQEGAGSNVLAVIDGTLVTPPLGPRILAGVSRAHLLDLAAREGIPVAERPLSAAALRSADEVLLTGTTIEVVGVVRVDGRVVGDGAPGPVTRRLAERFGARSEAAGRGSWT